MTDGTPKTLREAIENGLEKAVAIKAYDSSFDPASMIENHVRDYLAQKFGTEMMGGDEETVSRLWERVTGKKIKREAESQASSLYREKGNPEK